MRWPDLLVGACGASAFDVVDLIAHPAEVAANKPHNHNGLDTRLARLHALPWDAHIDPPINVAETKPS